MEIQQITQTNFIKGTFNSLKDFDFCGVYILYDDSDEIVYIGSAYARTIKERLQQYTRPNDSGNTLRNAIYKSLYDKPIKEMTNDNKNEIVEKIKELNIMAIEHKDLEYNLINLAKPIYNTAGVSMDTKEDISQK